MKIVFIILSFILITTQLSFGQKKQIITDTISVDGICEKCKARIEDAAFIKGVKKANWDMTTKKLVVIFDQHKTTLKTIETSIAKAGHDAGDIKALPADYNKLPSCCAYKDAQISH
jgi:hypothetical protein